MQTNCTVVEGKLPWDSVRLAVFELAAVELATARMCELHEGCRSVHSGTSAHRLDDTILHG
jgi:hypothetical protein